MTPEPAATIERMGLRTSREGDAAPLRLTFVIAGLAGGGAERVMTILANAAAARGHGARLLAMSAAGGDFYQMHPAVDLVRLNTIHETRSALHRVRLELRLLRALRREMRRGRPDAVIAFATETSVRVLLASLGLGLRVIVSERSVPGTTPVGRIWWLLRHALYRFADVVVAQTIEARELIGRHTSARRCVVIPNPVMRPDASARQVEPQGQGLVLAVGRLREEKGYDLLIRAFALTRAQHPGWQLAIAGDGPERERLERLVVELGLRSAVTLLGMVDDPGELMRRASLYVVPSRFEGFPNAMIEAMSCGLPVVSFDCPSGPRAIIRHETNGLLVPAEHVQALAAAMSRLMGDADLRQRLGGAAREVTSRFALDRVVDEWLALARGTTPRSERGVQRVDA
jgi:GalNAc-alpha-(1->4)-GalNAc-alpha-(1->3)-diNAcBac-PP-undecaprenol alpha-1,4-N-acetyl-D-galactosaminyltransferase